MTWTASHVDLVKEVVAFQYDQFMQVSNARNSVNYSVFFSLFFSLFSVCVLCCLVGSFDVVVCLCSYKLRIWHE